MKDLLSLCVNGFSLHTQAFSLILLPSNNTCVMFSLIILTQLSITLRLRIAS